MHEHHAGIGQAGQRIFQVECVHVVQWDELDILELGVNANVILGDRQVISGGQALLFRSVLGVRLNIHAKDFAGDGSNDLVGGNRSVTAHRVAAHRKRSGRSDIGIVGHRKGSLVFDSDREVSPRTIAAHVVDDGDEVAGADVTAA